MEIIKSISNESTPQRSTNNIKMIVVHDTASSAPFANLIKYLKKPDYISVHYTVEDGQVYQLVNDDHIAYHAGVSSYPNFETRGNSLNWCSLGIEVHSEGKTYSDAERVATKELIQYLMKKYDIPSRYVVRHKDIAPKRKIDIEDTFWNNEYASWEEYQSSLNTMTKEQKKATEACIAVLSSLWSKLSDEGKKIASETATKLRKL
jgi:N-acetylmuramoyl-L-alanine amidase